MPVHDWAKVDAGIFHAFRLHWISALSDVLNRGLLPSDYYALPEQYGAGFQPDVLTLEVSTRDSPANDAAIPAQSSGGSGTALITFPPTLAPTAETAVDFYRRKQNSLVVRHVSGDRMIAVIEIVSPGNKSSNAAIRKFIEKSSSLVLHGVHLLILDLFPPGTRDPQGLHAAIWDDLCGEPYHPPPGREEARRRTVSLWPPFASLRAIAPSRSHNSASMQNTRAALHLYTPSTQTYSVASR
jgi:hypothetical protein